MHIKEFMVSVHATAVSKGWWKTLPASELGEPACLLDGDTSLPAVFLRRGLVPRNVAEMVALMHSEIAEALEIHRMPDKTLADVWTTGTEPEAKPEGFVVEIVDLMIRIADTCEAMAIPLDVVLCNTELSMLGWGRPPLDGNVVEALQHMNVCLVHAFNALQNSYGRAQDGAAAAFAEVFQTCGQVFRQFTPERALEWAVVWKARYNESRPHRHGNKRC